MRLHAQVEAEQFEVRQAEHHAKDRRDVEKIMKTHGGCNCSKEQADDNETTGHDSSFIHLRVSGFSAGYPELHEQSRHHEVDDRREKQLEELGKMHNALLPHHQGRDISKRAESTTRVCAHHDIDATQRDEFWLFTAHRHEHRAHDQGGREVIGQRRDHERQHAGQPEQCPVAQTMVYQPTAQGVKHTAFKHGIDIGHCD